MGIRTYFKGARLAQMSSGTYCIIRDLGLVKGGKGLRHHENLLTLTVQRFTAKFVQLAQRRMRLVRAIGRPAVKPLRPLASASTIRAGRTAQSR